MFKKHILFIILLNIISGSFVSAQYIHFSQFNSAPLLLNPANTGNFDGDWRVGVNYRDQWTSLATPFTTLALGFDRQFYLYKEQFSGGLVVLRDESGFSLNTLKFIVSGAYHPKIKNNRIHIGTQVGLVSRSVDYSDVTTPGQYNRATGTGDHNLPSGEPNDGERLYYIDVNLGIGWHKKIGKFEPELGLAAFHVNFPDESFYNEKNRLAPQFLFEGKTKIEITEAIYIRPGGMIAREDKTEDIVLGGDIGVKFTKRQGNLKEAFSGAYVRKGINQEADAIAIIGSITYSRFTMGISYDLNISPLNEITNNHGAFELSIIYKSISTVLNTHSIPCERY